MTILVCGSRKWDDWPRMERELKLIDGFHGKAGITLLQGDCYGPDKYSKKFGKKAGWKVEDFPADWKTHGKAAGFKRNIEMLERQPDLVVAFWDGVSRGTKHTCDEAKKRNIPVVVHIQTEKSKDENAPKGAK